MLCTACFGVVTLLKGRVCYVLEGVEAVGEVAATGQVEAHDAVVGAEQGRVHGEVGGATAAHS